MNLVQEQITTRINQAILEKVFPGCVIGIIKKDGTREIFPFGHFTYESDAEKVYENSIYDVASITKAVPGTLALMKLIDEGKLKLEDKLSDFVPSFGNVKNKKEVTIKHLLTYTLDLDVPSLSSLKEHLPDEIMKLVIESPLRCNPGTTFKYTNSTALFFGLIIEKLIGKPLDIYAQETLFDPLGMQRTTFHPDKLKKNEIVPTENDSWRGRVIQAEVHDESTFILRKKYMVSIAGLFSTVPDLLNVQAMLLNKGEYKGKRFFSEHMVQNMSTNQLSSINAQAGLGWEMGLHSFGTHHSVTAFGKTGFTGCLMLTDIEKGIAFSFLSNRVYPHRPADVSAITKVRADIANIIFA